MVAFVGLKLKDNSWTQALSLKFDLTSPVSLLAPSLLGAIFFFRTWSRQLSNKQPPCRPFEFLPPHWPHHVAFLLTVTSDDLRFTWSNFSVCMLFPRIVERPENARSTLNSRQVMNVVNGNNPSIKVPHVLSDGPGSLDELFSCKVGPKASREKTKVFFFFFFFLSEKITKMRPRRR